MLPTNLYVGTEKLLAIVDHKQSGEKQVLAFFVCLVFCYNVYVIYNIIYCPIIQPNIAMTFMSVYKNFQSLDS